jgi:hypothetical protein
MRALEKFMVATAIGAVISGPVLATDEAKTINYSYVEGAFVHDNFNANGLQLTDRDGAGDMSDDNFGTFHDATGNGGAGRVSVELPFTAGKLGFHLVADYLQTSHDVAVNVTSVSGFTAAGVVPTTQKEWRAALGLHAEISTNISLFAELGVVNNKVNFSTATLALDTGVIAEAPLSAASGSKTSLDGKLGLRAMVTDSIELTGFVRYHGNGDLKPSADGLNVDFGGKVRAGAGAFYHFSEQISLGLDYEFGTPGRARVAARFSF